MRPEHSRAPRALPIAAFLVLPSFSAACAAPERSPLDAERLDLALERRDASPQALALALERSGLAPLALGALPEPGSEIDFDAAPFWHACALAFGPKVRAARRALAAATEREGSAGRPGPLAGFVELEELDDPAAFTRAVLTVDLVGLLGLGPAESARELARAEVRAARASLELAAWEALYEVDRARLELALARAERALLAELGAELDTSAKRVELLDRHGRLSAGALSEARIAEHRLALRARELEAREADARAALVRAAGLPLGSPALERVGARTLLALAELDGSTAPGRRALLERSPRLRAALLEYAVAEARLADEAAGRWPELRLGPQLLWSMDEFFLGLMAESAVAWPGSLDGRVRAALAEREAAREATEDLLLAEEARLRAARERLEARRAALVEAGEPAALQAERARRAAHARFSVEPEALAEWARALGMQIEAWEALFMTRAAALEAALELRAIVGPEQRLAEVRA